VYDPITMQGGQKKDVDFLAAPADTLQIGGGDCDDQALLMASLFSAVGLENRILFVDSADNGAHLLTQFAVHASLAEEVAPILDSFYAGNDRVPDSRSYLPFVVDERVWLIADTTRDYVGDYRSLVEQGFIKELPDGRYQWHANPVMF
jgi:transglutaminase-like putative cysteine protease